MLWYFYAAGAECGVFILWRHGPAAYRLIHRNTPSLFQCTRVAESAASSNAPQVAENNLLSK